MPVSLSAAIVLGSSSRAVSASFERDVAALPNAYKNMGTTRTSMSATAIDREKQVPPLNFGLRSD